MSLTLYAHPFSSYCQKVLVALYENEFEFEYRTLEDPSAMAELKARWPFARFPVLVDDGQTVVESTIIIEHLMLRHGGRVRWLPEDPEQRRHGRTWAAGENLSLADCAAAPSLFYADWVHAIADAYPLLRAYRSRLLAWPAFARAVDEARPFRHYFPLGAPDRD